MIELKTLSNLEGAIEIGSVSNLGAEVRSGNPEAKILFKLGNPETNVAVAYFQATEGSFLVDYPFSEHGTLVDGEVTLTDEATGKSVDYKAGDSWYIAKGSRIVFDVKTPSFTKHYMSILSE